MIPVRIALVGRIALVTPDALARAAHRFHDPGTRNTRRHGWWLP